MTSVVVNSSQQQQAMGGQPGVYRPLPNQYYPAQAPMAGQQSSNTNVVIANQPAPVAPVRVTIPTEKPSAATFIVTVILLSLCSFLGMWHLLFCLIPALILSVVGFNYSYSKSSAELRSQARVFTTAAAGLDIAATIAFAVTLVILAIVTAVVQTSYRPYYYYY